MAGGMYALETAPSVAAHRALWGEGGAVVSTCMQRRCTQSADEGGHQHAIIGAAHGALMREAISMQSEALHTER